MANKCEPLLNVVTLNRLKLLISLNQNGVQSDIPVWGYTDARLSAERRSLSCQFINYAERGKPVFLLLRRESPSQDEPMGMQVREYGKSECRAVMVRIGVETSPHAKACRLP